jgi:uncharacterized membrane protein
LSNARIMRWVTGGFELVLAIPVLGGLIVMGSSYSALGVMLLLHIVTLVLSSINKEQGYGSIAGIITSILAWIPILGWFLHFVTAILLLFSALSRTHQQRN